MGIGQIFFNNLQMFVATPKEVVIYDILWTNSTHSTHGNFN